MIVWLASFPRSGNTFLRIVLHRIYGMSSSTVYEVDGVARRLGSEFVGYRGTGEGLERLRTDHSVHLVKSHAARDERIAADDRAVCLVRDGRDAVVSWARQRAELRATPFEEELWNVICNPRRRPDSWDAGSWGENVLSWTKRRRVGHRLLRYEDLIDRPLSAVNDILSALDLSIEPLRGAEVPSFADLHHHDPQFFRRGVRGSYLDELPDGLHREFWSRPDNAEAMALLGYGRTPS